MLKAHSSKHISEHSDHIGKQNCSRENLRSVALRILEHDHVQKGHPSR